LPPPAADVLGVTDVRLKLVLWERVRIASATATTSGEGRDGKTHTALRPPPTVAVVMLDSSRSLYLTAVLCCTPKTEV